MKSTEDDAVREFVARHARPYDPETDIYDRPPFASDIKEGKNDPIYSVHPYHTKVPPRGIVPYILHYTEAGDVVLDPFCGSGMTGVAALLCADPPADLLDQFPELKSRVGPRHAILSDLSPAASHIAYNYTTPVDLEAFRSQVDKIRRAASSEFGSLYRTEHYEPAVAAYDSRRPEIAARLTNPPETAGRPLFESAAPREWELVSRQEVEKRLGYPVTELPRGNSWGELNAEAVDQWVAVPAAIRYTIWSDIYRCEGLITVEEPTGKISARGKNAGRPLARKKRLARGCGAEIVLWDVAIETESRTVLSSFACPSCGQRWTKDQLTLSRNEPVQTLLVPETDASKLGRQRAVARRISAAERAHIAAIEAAKITNWHPAQNIDLGREMMRHGLLSRGIRNDRDFYSPRLLRGLSVLWSHIAQCPDVRLGEALRFCFTAILHRSSRLNRLRPSGAGDPLPGTLYIGSFWREDNPLEAFLERAKAMERLAPLAQPGGVITACGSAVKLSGIADQSIDFLFADPPFGSNIYYADCSMLWESWLGHFTSEADEIVVNDRRVGGPKKGIDDYRQLMALSFAEMHRVLKPGRYATIEFNNSDGAVFEAIKDAIRSAGLEVANMLLLDKKQKTFKQVKGASGEDVVDKDVIINLRKPARVPTAVAVEEQDLEHLVCEVVREHLRTLPERMRTEPDKYTDDYRTTSTLNSVLMNALLPRGVALDSLSLPFIERVCGRYFRRVGQHWYLRGEAVGGATEERLFEEEVPVRDEQTAIGWIRQRLQSGSALVGELRAHWMRATGLLPKPVAEALVLEELLSANFWREPDTNRWREPTEEERAAYER